MLKPSSKVDPAPELGQLSFFSMFLHSANGQRIM
jgi:hypothetical protein